MVLFFFELSYEEQVILASEWCLGQKPCLDPAPPSQMPEVVLMDL